MARYPHYGGESMVRKGLFGLGVCLIGMLMITGSAQARKLLVVGEVFPPFEFYNKDVPVGIDVEIIESIFKKMGIAYEIRLMPFEEAWALIEQGKADAVFSTSRKLAREPFVWYPKEDMWVSEFRFFVRKDKKKPNFRGYADAKGLKVGVTKGNTYNPAFWDAKLTLVEAPDLTTSMQELAKGEVDLVPADRIVGRYTLTLTKLLDQIEPYDTVLFTKGYPMPFAKKSDYPKLKEVAERFEVELTAFKKSGAYVRILAKWLQERF